MYTEYLFTAIGPQAVAAVTAEYRQGGLVLVLVQVVCEAMASMTQASRSDGAERRPNPIIWGQYFHTRPSEELGRSYSSISVGGFGLCVRRLSISWATLTDLPTVVSSAAPRDLQRFHCTRQPRAGQVAIK